VKNIIVILVSKANPESGQELATSDSGRAGMTGKVLLSFW